MNKKKPSKESVCPKDVVDACVLVVRLAESFQEDNFRDEPDMSGFWSALICFVASAAVKRVGCDKAQEAIRFIYDDIQSDRGNIESFFRDQT